MNPPNAELSEYEIWARHVGQATRVLSGLVRDMDAVHKVAFDRFKSGLQVFGVNQRYSQMSSAELRYESLEELADALNYMIWHLYTSENA